MTRDSELHKNMVRCIRKAVRKAIRMTPVVTSFSFEEVTDALSESVAGLISNYEITFDGDTMTPNIKGE